MKDIKTLIIGFLLATSIFLFMGQGSNNSQIGKYQGFGDGVTVSIHMINTITGEVYTKNKHTGKWKKLKKNPHLK